MKRSKKVLFSFVCFAVLFGVSSAVFADEQVLPTLTVAGSATVRTVPDIAYVHFSIKTRNDDATVSQEENRTKSNAIYAELNKIGVANADTRTQSYTIRPIYENVQVQERTPTEFDADGNAVRFKTENKTDRIFQGYETVHIIVVTIDGVDEDVSLVGKVVDLSISYGANQSNGVSFALSDGKRNGVYVEALDEATGRANQRAKTVAVGLGLTYIKPVTVNIENIRVNTSSPVVAPSTSTYADGSFSGGNSALSPSPSAAMDMDVADSVPVVVYTPISPGEASVTASVWIIFTY
ncbi:hypothetical protein FACS189492_1100 [Clostridia bacterium]|nr:hypothetical protein FACS189492_1100 [Clostridia bacterium]